MRYGVRLVDGFRSYRVWDELSQTWASPPRFTFRAAKALTDRLNGIPQGQTA